MVRVLYFVHNLDDSAVWRRREMLVSAGATVDMIGFRRGDGPLPHPARLVGRTQNARMAQRAAAVLRGVARLRRNLAGLERPDAILVRQMEMLPLARRAARHWPGPPVPVSYELLDIHRSMLGNSPRARMMRAMERALTRDIRRIVISSPAFRREYLGPIAGIETPSMTVENKIFDKRLDKSRPATGAAARAGDDRITIGWLGILRCAWSLETLDQVTRAAPGRYRVLLRGRPAHDVLPDFDAVVGNNPDLEYGGPYAYPDDLAAIYRSVDIAWLIDRYEAGANSEWLLPNRLYEGCAHGAVPLALSGTETARYLDSRGIGLLAEQATATSVGRLLDGLTHDDIAARRLAIEARPDADWYLTADDAREFLAAIAATDSGGRPAPATAEGVLSR